MKISKEVYNTLKDSFKCHITVEQIEKQKAFIKEEGKSKDPSMRLRWDAYWYVRMLDESVKAMFQERGITDAHIDTCLRRVMKELFAEESQ